MNEFIKDKDVIVPMLKGLGYDLEKGKIYRLKSIAKMFTSQNILVEDGSVNIPEKVYYTDKDRLLIDRILAYHKTSNKTTTGVLFHGTQGCGKTLLAKVIAKECNLPVIVVDPSFRTRELMSFFMQFSTEVVVLFDELDKHCGDKERWDTKDLLEFLDGVQETGKKLVVFTCNETNVVSKFLLNRCGRIRYYKKFDTLDHDMITRIVADILTDENMVDSTVNFIETRVKLPSYDNITSICKELNDWPDYDINLLLEDLNIELKS